MPAAQALIFFHLLTQYRDEEPEIPGSNIMFDRRVVRGNTYAARILPADLTLTDKQSMGSS